MEQLNLEDEDTLIITRHEKKLFVEDKKGLKCINQQVFTKIDINSEFFVMNPQDTLTSKFLTMSSKNMVGKKLVLLGTEIKANLENWDEE